MTERRTNPESRNPDVSRATEFQSRHVYTARDFDSYQDDMIQEWKEQAKASLEGGKIIRPLWMRRNEGGGTYFGACIDYWIPVHGEQRLFAYIDIHSESGPLEIAVYFPDEETSEPIRATEEAYNLQSLQRAIDLVETTVQPPGYM